MALSGLDIYKLLPKTNCRECGFVTCLAFAMQLAKKAVGIDKCPFLSEGAKRSLEASALPPIRLVTIGAKDPVLEIGNETVLFRHEEKFHHPCGIGIIIEDTVSVAEIKQKVEHINALRFERVGQSLEVSLIAIRQKKAGTAAAFVEAVKAASGASRLPLVLMSDDAASLEKALEVAAPGRPLVYGARPETAAAISELAKKFCVPVVASAPDLESLSKLTQQLSADGVNDIVLEAGKKPVKDVLWDLTQIRRLALKKSNRALGYPVLTATEAKDPYEEAMEAATYIAKYAGIVLLQGMEAWEVLALLTLRQNIYTDPQKPLQIEPKLYEIGQVSKASPLLVTTNFSLTYYTVLGEVEASKVPTYILSVDTEGMSVLTAWAAEKFTPEKITDSLKKCGAEQAVPGKRLILPGYVAVMSGDLEEQSGWKVLVGPKEATGLPSFLKNL